ncbi:MAG: uroporphyrinogen decarboxylase [Hyphomicrobiaceae bacterium]|jgi:uroporphyrinogen decarboxylase
MTTASELPKSAISRGFGGLRVAFFESRMGVECEALVRKQGGVAIAAPSMRELPIDENPAALRFADDLLAGRFAAVVFLTGVGTRHLFAAMETRHERAALAEAANRTSIIARGPKPVAALKDLGVTTDVTVPEPNTWRELLTEIRNSDRCPSLQGKTIAVQEYGVSNHELLTELKNDGAEVIPVPVYRWALPEDLTPLRAAIEEIVARTVDVLLFTSSNQAFNLLEVARGDERETELREAIKETVVGSIGPVCTQTLASLELPVDFEPPRSKLGLFVTHAASVCTDLLLAKRSAMRVSSKIEVSQVSEVSPSPISVNDSAFLKACRSEQTPFTPIWLMRQAGRYMQEYREIRARVSFIELCKTPQLAAQVTDDAVRRLGVDAAILFSDILLIVEPMGLGLEYIHGDGPAITHVVRGAQDVKRLREVDVEASLPFVMDTIRLLLRELPTGMPLIGFSGAPFTLASYMIEGGGSRNYIHTKKLMYRDKGAWDAMMALVARAVGNYLRAQVEAGAHAVQLFDSWVGCLSPHDYELYVEPHTRAAIEMIPKGVPVIHFGTDTATLLELQARAGATVIGADQRTPIGEVAKRFPHLAIQGNLDPVSLFAGPEHVRAEAKRILTEVGDRPGHIFNLGHGIMPGTPVDTVRALVDSVHELSAR